MTVCNSQASSFEHGHATAAAFQINQPLLSFPFRSLPFPSFPVLSLSFPFLSLSFPFFPFLFPFFPFLSLPFPSFPFLSLSFPSFPFLSLPFPSFPFLSLPFPSCPFLSLPFPSFPFLSRMRSKGSRFTLGVWGLRVCSLDVAQPSATVRNRPRDCYMAVPMVSSPEGIISGGFQRRAASFCVAGAILLRRFQKIQKMRCSFRGRRSTLDVSIVILRSRRSTLDASCCFFLRIPLAVLRQVATRCRFRGRRGIL